MNAVTVLLPVLRMNEFFFETVESILQSDYSEVKLLIVHDDQSVHSDDLRGFEDKAKAVGIQFMITHSPSPGLVSALNHGLALSDTEFICRIDADDLMTPSRIKLQVEYLNKNPNVAVIGGQLRFMNELGEQSDRYSSYPSNPELTRSKLAEGCHVAHPAVMFRKSVIVALGGYRAFFKYAEDYDLWLRVNEFREISNLSDVVTVYRQHDGQMSSKIGEVDLYTRAAKHAKRLRNEGKPNDLPEDDASIELWLKDDMNSDSKLYQLKSMIDVRAAYVDSLIFRIKFYRSRNRLIVSFLLLAYGLLIAPYRMLRETYKFIVGRL